MTNGGLLGPGIIQSKVTKGFAFFYAEASQPFAPILLVRFMLERRNIR